MKTYVGNPFDVSSLKFGDRVTVNEPYEVPKQAVIVRVSEYTDEYGIIYYNGDAKMHFVNQKYISDPKWMMQ
jgi:hypothetical protein